MIEKAVQFGDFGQLVGVVSEPNLSSCATGFILVTAGLLDKTGPFRFYTDLAREVAGLGFVGFRFDLGDVGDSQEVYTHLSLKQRTELEIREAVDYLTHKYHLKNVVLCGLCSGAEDAFRYSEQDSRVTGVVMIDAFGYSTRYFEIKKRAFVLAKRLKGYLTAAVEMPQTALIDYKYMPIHESKKILTAVLNRKVDLHFIYTGGLRSTYNYKNQFWDMFHDVPMNSNVSVDYFSELGHTQLLHEDRQLMMRSILSRLKNRFIRCFQE